MARNFPAILEACDLLTREMSGKSAPQFVHAAASGLTRTPSTSGGGPSNLSVKRIEGETYDALAAADCAIIASGTATVEAALLGTPMVVVYRVAPLTALILRRMVHTPFFSMVNLVAGRRVVPELIQDEFTPAAVAAQVRRLLESPALSGRNEGGPGCRAHKPRHRRCNRASSRRLCPNAVVVGGSGNCARLSGILTKGNRPFQERFPFCSISIDCPLF